MVKAVSAIFFVLNAAFASWNGVIGDWSKGAYFWGAAVVLLLIMEDR